LAPDSVDEFIKETMVKRFPSKKVLRTAGSIEIN